LYANWDGIGERALFGFITWLLCANCGRIEHDCEFSERHAAWLSNPPLPLLGLRWSRARAGTSVRT
jgi:hypothetical protein